MIPAGTFNKDGDFELIDSVEHFATAAPAYMKLPVTSVNGYAAFVNQVASSLKRPPFGVITKVSVVPDAKSQFRVLFQALEKVGDDVIGTIVQRNKEVSDVIDFPYTIGEEEEEEKPPAKSKAAKKPVTKKKPAAKKKRKY
jgi:hypothetical protein